MKHDAIYKLNLQTYKQLIPPSDQAVKHHLHTYILIPKADFDTMDFHFSGLIFSMPDLETKGSGFSHQWENVFLLERLMLQC